MAQMYPASAPPEANRSETQVFRVIAERMGSDWHAFFGVKAKIRGRRAGEDAEADFILVHPQHGLVVLEVKGAPVRRVAGRWERQQGNAWKQSSDPFEQAASSMHYWIGRLKHEIGRPVRCEYAVLFLAGAADELAPGLAELALGPQDLRNIEAHLIDLLGRNRRPPPALTRKELQAVVRLLGPTVQQRHSRQALIEQAELELTALTHRQILLQERQIEAIELAAATPHLIIDGAAGTGKTLLAVHQAWKLRREGREVLFLCHRRVLARYVNRLIRDVAADQRDEPPAVETFGGWMARQVREANLSIRSTWPSAEDLLAALDINALSYDAVVVDEAQEIDGDHLLALLAGLPSPDDSPFYLYADLRQRLSHTGSATRRGTWRPPFPGRPFSLLENCRNTVAVARAAVAFADIPWTVIGAEGLPVQIARVEGPQSASQLAETVASVLTKLWGDYEFAAASVALLSVQCEQSDFANRTAARLRATLPPDYQAITFSQLERNQELPDASRVVVAAPTELQGLEVDVVIFDLSRFDDDEPARAAAYVGLSRGRQYAIVVATEPWERWLRERIRAR